MLKFFISALIAIVLSSALHGQDNIRYSIVSLNIGAEETLNKDRFQSPYTYRGINASFRAAYSRVTLKYMHSIDFSYSTGKIQSIVSPRAHSQLLLVNYSYLLNVSPGAVKKKFGFSTGLGIQGFLNTTNYLPDIELSTTYLTASAFLALSENVSYSLSDKSELQLKTAIPLFGLVYRPDFEINGKSLTKAATAGNTVLFNAKLQYIYNLRSRTSVMASCDLTYFKFNEPRSISVLWTGLSVGVSRKF